jgi:Fe-S cluster biogenesis protein NfuA
MFQIQIASAIPRRDQDRRDGIATQREKHINAEQAAWQPRRSKVITNDGGHCERPNAVKTWEVADLRTGGARHGCPSAQCKGDSGKREIRPRDRRPQAAGPDFVGGHSRWSA